MRAPGRRFNGAPRVTVQPRRSRPAFAYILNVAVKNADMQTIWMGSSCEPARKSIFWFLKGNLLGSRWRSLAAHWPWEGGGRHLSAEPSRLWGSFPATASEDSRTESQGTRGLEASSVPLGVGPGWTGCVPWGKRLGPSELCSPSGSDNLAQRLPHPQWVLELLLSLGGSGA